MTPRSMRSGSTVGAARSRTTRLSRWRTSFKLPYAEMDRYCSTCGKESMKREVRDLTVIKFHSENRPLGMLRTYCPDHLDNFLSTSTVRTPTARLRSRRPAAAAVREVEAPPCGLEFLHSRGLCGCGEEE